DVGKPPTHAIADDGKHTFHGHDMVGAMMTRDILTRLRFSNDEVDTVALLVQLHLRPIYYGHEAWSDAAVRRLIAAAGDQRARLIDVAQADTLASSFPTTAGLDELAARMSALDAGGQVSHLADTIDGDELMRAAGRGAGPWVG